MLDDITKRINQLTAEYRVAVNTLRSATVELITAEDKEIAVQEAHSIIQNTVLTVQQQIHNKIAAVVSMCLRAIFDDPYEFQIVFEKKRNKTEAKLVFVRRGLELEDPLNSVGGGVVDVAAFALRLACLVLEKPVKRRLLVLDEPFSRLRGRQNRERMRDLIQVLSQDFGVQFVVNIDVDQFPEFRLGSVVELGS